jgi:hypothetical protein
MTLPGPAAPQVKAPTATKVLAEILGFGVLAQAAFAGGFLGGHHVWLNWHQRLGDLLIVVPLAILVVGLMARSLQPEKRSMLVTRIVLLAVVVGTEATGHAAGSLLALHIPLAVTTMALAIWVATVAADGRRPSIRLGPDQAERRNG